MAPFLLNNVELIAGGERLLIREIEFYFTSKTHPDPFTHCQPLQEQSLIWYFHRSGKSYKSGTYKGLDIAIGQGHDAPGGILIRTLEQLSNNKIICGPCNSVDHILKLCGASNINSLVENDMKNDISVFGGDCKKLYLYPLDTPNSDKILHTGRVGLYMTKKNIDVNIQADYVFRNYRSVTEPKKIWKGRHLMALSLLHSGKSISQISNQTGIKEGVIIRYQNAYNEGLSSNKDLSIYTKRIGDNLACICFGAIISTLSSSKQEKSEEHSEEDNKDIEIEESEEDNEDIEIEESEEDNIIETISDITTEIDLNCIIPWIRWKVSNAIINQKSPITLNFHPFPHEFAKTLFGDLITKSVKTSTIKGISYSTNSKIIHTKSTVSLTPKQLEPILGKNWNIQTNNNKSKQIKGNVKLTIITTKPEGELILEFTTK